MAGLSEGRGAFFRLSPAVGHAGKGPAWYAIQRGQLKKRVDAYSNQPHFRALFARIQTAGEPVSTFAELASSIFSGATPLAKGNAYVDPPLGVRFLRSGEITADGEIESTSDVHINQEIHDGTLKRSQLKQGDLLVAIVGATIGAAGIYPTEEAANINQAIAAVRLREGAINRQYALWYLHSSLGQHLLDYFKRPVARANINLEEVGEIPLIVPTTDRQIELVLAMNAARDERRAKLVEADAQLAGLDNYALNALGLKPPAKDERKVFAVSKSLLGSQARLNADYFHPERILALRALESPMQQIACPRLEQVVDFIREQIKMPGPDYLSLANVQSHTGELVPSEEDVKGACSTFQQGDVLFARLRPYLNKVYAAESDGCCSPEFHVLRVKDTYALQADYLAAILRSSLTLAQTRHMMTGNTHPRLSNEDVVNLVIPVPKPAVQEAIANEARRRREEARRLRAEAEADWQAAKRWFEEQLLGPAQP